MRRVVLAATLTLLGAPIASAQPAAPTPTRPAITQAQTTAELAVVCDPNWSDVPRLEAIAYCQGFLTGAGQYHALLHPAGGPMRPLFCVPNPGPSIAQSGLAFATWARANPTRGSEPAMDGFLRWAQSAHPCPPAAATPARAATPRAAR